MDTLSSQTLSRVCSFLENDDLRQFRLVNKHFSEVGAQYICTEMFLKMTHDHLRRLFELSRRPHLAQALQSLHYAPNNLLLPDHHEEIPMRYREKFYTETPETVEIYEIHSDSSFDENETDEEEIDDDEMYEEEMAFDKLKEEQSEIIRTHYDFMCFSITLPLFPRLQQITLYFGDEEQLDDEPQSPAAGSHHLTTLLDVISETKIKIKCLTLFNLNWEFFSEKDDAQLQDLFKPVAKLEHLELILDSTNYLPGPTMEDAYTYYQNRTHRGVLRKSLATLTNLRTLNIVLNNPFPFWSTYAMPLNQIVPPNPTWTRLATLKLSGFSCERQELMKFLLCHQASLRRLCLRNVSLKNTSWVPLLAQIRKELYLTGPCICGTLMGRSEKDDRQFYYCKKRRHSKVNRYIERGGKAYPDMTVCPLKERNETK